MGYKEFRGKTVEEALTAASVELGVTSTDLDYEVVEKGSSGFLGFGAKDAVIRARKKEEEVLKQPIAAPVPEKVVDESIVQKTKEYLDSIFKAMNIETKVDIEFDSTNNSMSIELEGNEMGILIGKRGQTLDAIQYLTSLFVNKESKVYVHVKMDTENYRARRKDALETLARNLAYKVKKTKRSVTLEPMNPYERRIIHSALQNDRVVATRSEGEEPYRKVVIYLKK